MTLQYKTYDASDLQVDGYGYTCKFIADVAGDNSDLFDYAVSNHDIAKKLTELGAVSKGVKLDPETCCFYAYFKTDKDGLDFLKKLSAYLKQKSKLLEKAKAY